MSYRKLFLGVFSLGLVGAALSPVMAAKNPVAVFETTLGTFKVELRPDWAPKTVENFVGLAKGTKEFVDSKTGEKVKKPFYNGIIFHRVIENFMIQGGDPTGTGRGGPGYQFNDEFDKHPGFTKKGQLAMANAGPNTNGSQFFITTAVTSHLNPRDNGYGQKSGHTIFGEVMEGYDVVEKIEKVEKGPGDRPVEPVVIKSVTIIDTK